MDQFRFVLFDFDDTLVATASSRWKTMSRTARQLGFELPTAKLRQFWGAPFDELIANLVPASRQEIFLDLYLREVSRTPAPALPGALALLARLYRYRIPIAIVTSGSRKFVLPDFKNAGFHRYVRILITCEDTSWHKPDPRALGPVLRAASSAGVANSELLMVGDSVNDWLAALAAGIPFVGVRTGIHRVADFARVGCERHVDDLDALSSDLHIITGAERDH